MRFRLRKPGTIAVSLLLAFHLGLTGCSSTPSDEEELQNSEEAANSEQGEEQYANNYENGEEQGAEGDEAVADETDSMNSAEDATVAEEGGTGEAVTNNESEQDLQDIISELNDNGSANGSAPTNSAAPAAVAESLPMNGAPAAVPDATVVAQTSAPAPTSAPAGGSYLPEAGSKMPYIVQKGDTLAKIAEKIYGASDKWQQIQELTHLSNPNRIYPGDVVYYHLDNGSNGFAQQYESTPRKQVVVQEGDTLSSIAGQVYGTSLAWKFLWRENGHIDNPDVLTVGTVVYYKEFAAGTPLAEMIRQEAVQGRDFTVNTVSVIPKNMI